MIMRFGEKYMSLRGIWRAESEIVVVMHRVAGDLLLTE